LGVLRAQPRGSCVLLRVLRRRGGRAYFYEPFLEAFDPELRKELGVWYTPREVVKYMVERVDRVLREDLNRPAGLADPNVYILDPCCGTGAFWWRRSTALHKPSREFRGCSYSHRLEKGATERVFGFEILPAPFVVSHLQIGLMLQHHGAPLSDKKKERRGSISPTRLPAGSLRRHRKSCRLSNSKRSAMLPIM